MKLNLGIGLSINKQSTNVESTSYSEEYKTLLRRIRMDGLPAPTQEDSIKANAFIEQLKTDGNYTESELLYILGWYNPFASLYNWVNPDNFKCSFIGSLDDTYHTVDVGYRTKFSSGLNTNYNPSTQSLPQNSTIWAYCENLNTKDWYCGVNNGTNLMYEGVEAGTIYSRLNTNGAENVGSISPNIDFLAIKRIGDDIEIYENDSLKGTLTRTFSSVANANYNLLCVLIPGVYVPQENVNFFAAGIGKDIDVAKLYDSIVAYKNM